MGKTLSVEKTEAMCTTQAKQPPIPVMAQQDKDKIAFVDTFEYLGCQIKFDGDCPPDILHRIEQARKSFWKLASTVWYVQDLSLEVKMLVFRACVMSVLLYGCETWTTTFSARHKLRLFYMMCLRVISRVTRWQQQHWHLSNDILRG